MSEYSVTVKRWNRGWELHVDDLGVTQARNLREADAMVRDYIAILDGDEAATGAKLNYTYELPAVGKYIEARSTAVAAERASVEAAARSRSAIAELVAQGISGADMARLLALSPQRVSQLVAGMRKRPALPKMPQVATKSIRSSPARTAAKKASTGNTVKKAAVRRSGKASAKSR